jgi:hypothetical protein
MNCRVVLSLILVIVASVVFVAVEAFSGGALSLKNKLLELLAAGGDDSGEKLVEIVAALEQGFIPIQTRAFFDVAVSGDWDLKYSTCPSRPGDDL